MGMLKSLTPNWLQVSCSCWWHSWSSWLLHLTRGSMGRSGWDSRHFFWIRLLKKDYLACSDTWSTISLPSQLLRFCQLQGFRTVWWLIFQLWLLTSNLLPIVGHNSITSPEVQFFTCSFIQTAHSKVTKPLSRQSPLAQFASVLIDLKKQKNEKPS